MLYRTVAVTFVATLCTVPIAAQRPGALKEERHPELSIATCTKANGCQSASKSVVIDQNWRWLHETGSPTNCYSGNHWDTTLCPDAATCAQNCVLEGADAEYHDTYGISAQGNALNLGFVTQGPYSKNVGSRTFLMEDEEHYKLFKLKNREFTFDADVSKLPCGLNGALYFVQMDADGGKSKYSGNTAGAKYGTGYCDAQCPHDLKWINGEPNMMDWQPSATDPNAGIGRYGSCCVEFDVFEANKISTAYTAHACDVQEQTRCDGVDCGDNASGDRFRGKCDKNGCDFQTYRLGNTTFWGEGNRFQLDTSKPVTVVTQYITEDNTDTGKLKEIKRFYKQGGKIIHTPTLAVGSYGAYESLSEDYCTAEKKYFNDGTNFLQKGGFDSMDDAMEKGMVLVMSLWDDHDVNMLWLDSTYPVNGTKPGDARGTCATTSGVPADVEKNSPDAKVSYSNIRFGEIGSTLSSSPPPAVSPPPPPPASSCPGGSLQQCIAVCPSSPSTVYRACVNSCLTRCSSSVALAAEAAPPAKPWGVCAGACTTGWECTSRGSFRQCTPTKPLMAAFHKSHPMADDLAAFFTTGVTHFPASGLVGA